MPPVDVQRQIFGDDAQSSPLRVETATCPICDTTAGDPAGVGYDFDYGTSTDGFIAITCAGCGLVYLDRRPVAAEQRTIYPDSYRAFDFGQGFGLLRRVRKWLERRRLRQWTRGLPADARILDGGCRDGFHLDLLRGIGPDTWRLEGVDIDGRAIDGARRRGLHVHQGTLEELELPEGSYHLIILIATIEHVRDPLAVLNAARKLLAPGGRLGIATDNTNTPMFRLYRGGFWGGYHFPRHFHLFNLDNLGRLAAKVGLEPEWVRTAISPVNCVYSIRNALVAHRAPAWLVNRFSLASPVSLGVFTIIDYMFRRFGKGGLVRASFAAPDSAPEPVTTQPPAPAVGLAPPRDATLILGAGFAGLVAARELDRRGVDVTVFEAAPHVGGLARSFHDEDGFAYDFGAHFITNRLAAVLGVSSQCRVVHRYDESVLLDGRFHGYPFGLLKSPRFVASAASARLSTLFSREPPDDARTWFRQQYGKQITDRVAAPLLEAWAGAPASELAPSVGDKLPGTVQSLWLKTAARISGRAVGCGYSREPEGWNVWHVYPRKGVGKIVGDIAAELSDRIRLESPVQRIHVENGRVCGVTSKGEFHPATRVFSTAPVDILARLVDGADLSYLERFQYRPMVFVNLLLKGRGLLPSTMLWTPEERFPFFRLAEAPLSMPWLAPEGHTIVTADIGSTLEEPFWKMEDEELAELCLAGIEEIVPGVRSRFLRCRTLRTPFAYPVYRRDYEADRRRFNESLGVEGLYSIGRNGRFSHDLMEDVYWRTRRAINASIDG